MTFLRIWLWGSAAVIGLIVVWTVAPVVFFLLLLTAALGLVSALMIAFARGLEAWRRRRARSSRPGETTGPD